MQKINSGSGLQNAILELENKQAYEAKMLKAEFHLLYERIQPINLIKSTFKEVVDSQELKDKLVNTSVGLATGYLTEKLFIGKSHNPIKKILGAALLFGITNVVAKKPETIRSLGVGFLNLIRFKPAKRVDDVENHKHVL